MNFKHLESEDKLRGGFYTSPNISEKLIDWALIGKPKKILEPGCGNGAFLKATHKLIQNHKINNSIEIDGIEIVQREAEKAQEVADLLKDMGIDARIINTDFLSWIEKASTTLCWDAIVGNPPYIRYQYFEKDQRESAEKIFKKANVPFTKRTNAWVPFVIASIMHLSPGGRLAMVVPAELLHILHAEGLRNLLEQEMETVNIIDVREMAFENALQGVVLLLAIKKLRPFRQLENKNGQPLLLSSDVDFSYRSEKPAQIDIHKLNSLKDLDTYSPGTRNIQISKSHLGEKWTPYLLENDEVFLLEKIIDTGKALRFTDIAQVDIGIVTGANNFFVVTQKTAEEYNLTNITKPMLARSEFIKGISYTLDDHEENISKGKAVLFLEFPNKPKNLLPEKTIEYLSLGERQKLHTRYKCRIRDPWYVVPYIWVSEISLLKRCHDYPRLVLNSAHAYSTDTAYRIIMNTQYKNREIDFVFSFINSLTLLLAELGGRYYGGGVLELVPSEIEKLYIPLTHIEENQFVQVDSMIRDGVGIEQILSITDPIVLGPQSKLNLTSNEILVLKNARNRLKDRRMRVDTQN